jgi:chromosome segregation ATPase
MAAEWTIVVGILGVVLGPLAAYIVAARRFSGKVTTSEASQLWDESKSMREDYRERLRLAGEDIARLAERISRLEEANDVLRGEVRHLETSNEELRIENAALKLKVEQLERENAGLRAEVAILKRDVNGT